MPGAYFGGAPRRMINALQGRAIGRPWLSQQLALVLDHAPRPAAPASKAGPGRAAPSPPPPGLPAPCAPSLRHHGRYQQLWRAAGGQRRGRLQHRWPADLRQGQRRGGQRRGLHHRSHHGAPELRQEHPAQPPGARGRVRTLAAAEAPRALPQPWLPASLSSSPATTTPRCSLARGSRRWTRSAGATRRRAAFGWPAPPRSARRCRRLPVLPASSSVCCQSARLPSNTR